MTHFLKKPMTWREWRMNSWVKEIEYEWQERLNAGLTFLHFFLKFDFCKCELTHALLSPIPTYKIGIAMPTYKIGIVIPEYKISIVIPTYRIGIVIPSNKIGIPIPT